MNDMLTERPLGSRASGAYEQGRLSEVDMKSKRAHHLQEVCEKSGKIVYILLGLYDPLTQSIVCEGGRLLVGAREGRPKLMQNGSGDGNPKKWGQFASLADPPGGCHFGFIKVVVDVVC